MEPSSNRIPIASSSSRKAPRSSAQNRFQFGPPPQLKSQYPADSTEKHVDYILVASFDIDRGPIMEYQYPGPISGDENMLAELMLPDQAHVRNQDWTIFFLHKDLGEQVEKQAIAESKRQERRRRLESNEDSTETDGEDTPDSSDEEDIEKEQETDGGDGPPLIYVQNLVNTKQDASAKRGAVVKAMAICTRHSFLHIYKPLLLLALEEYFKSPFPETLAALYDAVNSMDLSLMPQLSTLERHILQASDLKDLFAEKFEQMIQQRLADESRSNSLSSPESPTKMNAVQHGPKYTIPRDTHEFETKVMYHQVPIPIKVPTAISPETVGDFSIIKLIQAFSTLHTTSPQPFMIHPHLTTSGAYTHPIIVLVNAMLTQKRVIFLGHNRPSGEVAEAVLAACALASGGILRGFTRHAFPYTDLTKIDDLLQVPGFIAGVTNPAFANHPEWWDLLCDVSTGRMKISNRIEPAAITQGLIYFQQQNPTYAPNSTGAISNTPSLSNPDPTGDVAFIDDILRSITARHGESAIRCKWRDYITKFTRIAAALDESVYGASALYPGTMEMDAGAHGVRGHGYVWPDEQSRLRELGANVCRIEGWRNTRSYFSFIQDLVLLFERRPIRSLDLAHQHDRLRTLKLSHDDSGAIYLALSASIRTYDEVSQLLTVMPESNAGLFYISLGLFHPDPRVRMATADLLECIVDHEAGKHFWAHLGRFAKLAYVRTRSRDGGVGSPLDSSAGMGHFGSMGLLDARVHSEVGRAS